MKIRIEQLLNDKFEYDVPKLMFSEEEIRVTVPQGSRGQGTFYVGTQEDVKIRGFAVSSHRRFVPGVERFLGTAIQIPYGIDASGMQGGDHCQGEMILLTNLGEAHIPFFIQVEESKPQSSIGRIRCREDFVRLARTNFSEAFRLFTDPSFGELLEMEEERAGTLYAGMSHQPITYQHLEEFLIGLGEKEPVHISFEQSQAEYYQVTETVQEYFVIKKSGWGHLRLEAEVIGDFIQVDKRVVTDEDFIGSSFRMEYRIEAKSLGQGKKFGKIRLKTAHESLDFHITASLGSDIQVNLEIYEKKQKLKLYKTYLQFRLHRLDYKVWVKESLETLEDMAEAGCDYPIYQVYEAYVYYMDDQVEQAKEILLKYQDKNFTEDDLELAGIYLYVCHLAGLLKDRGKVAQKLRILYKQKPNSFLLLWVLIQLDDELLLSTSKTLYRLEEQFHYGSRSPLLYLEAFQMVEKDISLLPHLNSFWIQVLLSAARNEMVREEIAVRIAYLSDYKKSFEPCLYQLLTCLYQQFPGQDILEAVCKLILKGNPREKRFFPWFSRAVEENLRITGLFEYYMDTMDMDTQRMLPKNLCIYFLYNSTISDQKKALLYANIVRHREEDPQSYASYRKIIKEFSRRRLKSSAMDENYAVLYHDCMEELEIEELQKIVFTHRLYCDRPDIRYVVICHGPLLEEAVYPCVNGLAYPQIYSEDAVILFQDNRKCRYEATVDYNLRALFDKEMLEYCGGEHAQHPGFLLNQCSQGGICEENEEVFLRIAASDAFTPAYRKKIRKILLDYHRDAGDEKAEKFLASLDIEKYVEVDKVQLAEMFISHGLYEKAYEIYCEYGLEGVRLEALVKLCSRLILSREFEEDEDLTALAVCVFQNKKYDEVVLQYLMQYYIGPVSSLYQLWCAARDFQMDTYQLEEDLLAASVFVRDYFWEGSQVLEHYVRHKGKEQIIIRYLTFWSYGYFVWKKPMPEYVAQYLELVYDWGWPLELVCRLALFAWLCEKRKLSDSQSRQLQELLEECYHRNLTFAFFRKLPRELLGVYQLDDKVFVECIVSPRAKVTIHYALDTGMGDGREYRQEPLPNLFEGIHGRAFTLFYGEAIHYYFSIELDGKEKKTSEKTLTKSMSHQARETKYQMLNEILAAKKLGKMDALKEKMTQYLEQEKFVENMFPIVEGTVYERN